VRWHIYSEIITLKLLESDNYLLNYRQRLGGSFLAAEHAWIMLKSCIARKMVTEVAKTVKAAT